MAIMNTELYRALKEAGASEESSARAAEAVASYENRFARIEADLLLLKWMLGTNVALTLGVLAILLRQ